MANNEILPFAGTDTGTNLLTQAEYNADSQRPIGNQPGVARSKLVNKVLRQTSLIAAAVAQFLANRQANDITDSLTPATLAGYFLNVIGGDIQKSSFNASAAGGTVDAITGTFTPAITALSNGLSVFIRASGANTATVPTFTPNNGTVVAKAIVKGANQALVAGDIAGAGHWLELQYDSTLDKWVLQNPANGVNQVVVKQIQTLTASVAANVLTVNLPAGNLDFHSTTQGDGTPVTRSFSALSLSVPASATLGVPNGQVGRLLVLAIDNAGTVELAIVNQAGGNNLDEVGVKSTTTLGAGSTANNVLYSATGRTNVSYRVVGFVDAQYTGATGWATAPATVQGVGGQALTSLQSLGMGQTWQTVTRTNGTTYYNTTGKPIALLGSMSATSLASFSVSINGGGNIPFCSTDASTSSVGMIIIPAGAAYTMVISGSFSSSGMWELR